LESALKRGYTERQASDILDLLKRRSGFTKSKADSISRSILEYQTAYLEANYPEYFQQVLKIFNKRN